MLGTYVLSAGYYDAYYLKAQRVRTLIRRDFERAFQRGRRHRLTDLAGSPRFGSARRWAIRSPCTWPTSTRCRRASPASPPSSVPCAPTKATSDRPALPVGLQLAAPPLEEERLFTVAAAAEAMSPARSLALPG